MKKNNGKKSWQDNIFVTVGRYVPPFSCLEESDWINFLF
jgi:hypothetical protein